MSDNTFTISDPVIISPSTQLRLDELDAKHQFEDEQLAQLEAPVWGGIC